jgi:LysR family glycine cleavage system transcriptional activator
VPRLNPEDIWWKQWFDAAGLSEGETRPGIRLDSQAMEGNAALAGHGVGMLTPLFWQSELEAKRLVQLFELTTFEGPSYWLVYPEHKRTQPKIRHFRDWIIGQFEELRRLGPQQAFLAPSC